MYWSMQNIRTNNLQICCQDQFFFRFLSKKQKKICVLAGELKDCFDDNTNLDLVINNLTYDKNLMAVTLNKNRGFNNNK